MDFEGNRGQDPRQAATGEAMNIDDKPVWMRPMVAESPPTLCVGGDQLPFTVGEAILWAETLQEYISAVARRSDDGRGQVRKDFV